LCWRGLLFLSVAEEAILKGNHAFSLQSKSAMPTSKIPHALHKHMSTHGATHVAFLRTGMASLFWSAASLSG